jgi:hypothetical protein
VFLQILNPIRLGILLAHIQKPCQPAGKPFCAALFSVVFGVRGCNNHTKVRDSGDIFY